MIHARVALLTFINGPVPQVYAKILFRTEHCMPPLIIRAKALCCNNIGAATRVITAWQNDIIYHLLTDRQSVTRRTRDARTGRRGRRPASINGL
jgi:hypothetical protein